MKIYAVAFRKKAHIMSICCIQALNDGMTHLTATNKLDHN